MDFKNNSDLYENFDSDEGINSYSYMASERDYTSDEEDKSGK